MIENGSPSVLERLLRELAPRVLGALARSCGDFAAAEDAVQEALLAAATDWPRLGTPQNPGGWLFRVARRRLADQVESELARRRREKQVAAQVPEEAPAVPDPDELGAGDPDDTLRLLFTCCHPALSPASAIALTLRAVGGLSNAAIASAFLVPEATMAQRISRAKQVIKSSGVPFELPGEAGRARRLGAVLRVLYLLFNEGHTSSSGLQLVRVELSAEGIRLARSLHELLPDDGEVAGLLALMLLTDARRPARADDARALIPLDEQDRSLWDRAVIAEGTALVEKAFARGHAGSYQIQAAIAALHAAAENFAATDWPQILALYGLLQRLSGSPVVALNCAIAEAMVNGPAAGIARLNALDTPGKLLGNFRLDAARAHLQERAGEIQAAMRSYEAAAARTQNEAERSYLLAKAARLRMR